ncbi:MAG: response regulator transcription factor [Bacteroidia bacterium]|nr:response regulator transcription factor [Bacteroidia bacterium]
MKTRIFIIEDEFLHLEALKITVEEAEMELVGECSDADSAFEKIKKQKPDVLLVDIALPGLNNGITLAHKVHTELQIPHIFTTSFTHDEIIAQAVETQPAAYLRKPVELVQLKAAIQIALNKNTFQQEKHSQTASNLVFVKIGEKLVKVDLNEVLIVKADGDNCIALITEKKEYLSRATLKEFCRQLPAGFIQTHRSYYININHLDSFNERNQTACLKGRCAPVARNFRKDFLESIRKI